jgi:hypothetical protein
MRWFRIRKARIDQELRETFEQYGVPTMQTMAATTNYLEHKGTQITVRELLPSLLPWLTEQYDRVERKETWSLTMEVAITLFVAIELAIEIVKLIRR